MRKVQDERHEPVEDALRSEAAEWFARLRSETFDEATHWRFELWRDADPAHRAEYQAIAEIWEEMGGFAETPRVAFERRVALSAGVQSPFVRRSARSALPFAASLLLLLASALLASHWASERNVIRTAVGEQADVVLADGSMIRLNTDTALTVRLDAEARRIRLDRGQAYFSVAKDPSRPFTVSADGGSVTALGTAFEVRKTDDDVVVTLFEGTVKVKPVDRETAMTAVSGMPRTDEVILAALDDREVARRISYSRKHLSSVEVTPLEEVAAWQEGKLVLDNRPLDEAISEFNRYLTRKIVIVDPALKEVRVSGVFHTDRADDFVRAIEHYFDIRVERGRAGEIVLRPAD